MNNMFNSSNQTPGQIIRAVRDSKQISLNEVAKRLLLSKQIIIALEEDNYSKISAQVYAEGYLRAYANFLKIPVDQVIGSFRKLNIYAATEDQPSNSQAKQDLNFHFQQLLKNKKIRLLIVIGFGFLMLVGLFSFVSRVLVKQKVAELAESNETKVLNVGSSLHDENGSQSLPVIITNDEPDIDLDQSRVKVHKDYKNSSNFVSEPKEQLPKSKNNFQRN